MTLNLLLITSTDEAMQTGLQSSLSLIPWSQILICPSQGIAWSNESRVVATGPLMSMSSNYESQFNTCPPSPLLSSVL